MADLPGALLAPFTADPRSAFWVIVVASLTNVACALVGCYLVLRRMSLLGDAISHAVLPGLAVAFLFSGSVAIGYMFVGALVAGLLTTFLTQTLHRYGGVAADASMGVVFTSLFALGVLLIGLLPATVHIDQDCVLEGLLDYVGVPGMNSVSIGGVELPRQFLSIAPVLLLNVSLIALLWKEFKISSFDPALATTMGLRAGLLYYVLMAMVSLTTVASFEAVGSILVVAMLIAPAATAHLLCDRMARMLVVASAVAVAAAVLGYWLAVTLNTNVAGMMAVAAGLLYALAVLVSPRYGIVSTLVRNMRISLRILSEDLLAMLYRVEELATDRALAPAEATRAVGGGLLARWSLRRLVSQGSIVKTAAGLRLSSDGRQRAANLVRSHRLWEAYLVEYLGLPLDHVHEPAERMEHFIDEKLRRELAEELSEAERDPHGREIPE